jgi:hypothetical protein
MGRGFGWLSLFRRDVQSEPSKFANFEEADPDTQVVLKQFAEEITQLYPDARFVLDQYAGLPNRCWMMVYSTHASGRLDDRVLDLVLAYYRREHIYILTSVLPETDRALAS